PAHLPPCRGAEASGLGLAARRVMSLPDRRCFGSGQAQGESGLWQRGRAGPGLCAIRRRLPGQLFPACEEAAPAGGHTKNRAISQHATRGGGGACRPSRPTPAAVPAARKRVEVWIERLVVNESSFFRVSQQTHPRIG